MTLLTITLLLLIIIIIITNKSGIYTMLIYFTNMVRFICLCELEPIR